MTGTGSISSVGSGYYSCSYTVTANGTGNSTIAFYLNNSSSVDAPLYAGDVGSGVDVTYAQVNEGTTALPYQATTDLQSFANTVSGGAALVRGTTAGSDTNDPTPRLVGLSFAVDDNVAGIPAKGSTWTTINCSEAHCYGVDSAGGSFVDGVSTPGATEFNLGTAGGYTGIASYLLRYNRVLSLKDHRTNYATFLKIAINAKGGTLP